jgi:hypothetical protein
MFQFCFGNEGGVTGDVGNDQKSVLGGGSHGALNEWVKLTVMG